MDLFDCAPYCYNSSQCMSLCTDHVQTQLEEPMPWIGMYIAAASAACSLAMAADAFNGFRSRKFWFPCKYFSLNAFSLTVLAVAMKLSVDLTSMTVGDNDKLARINSLVLMPTAMGNFMTSLGSMEDNEIVLNIAALGILVTTIIGNVIIKNIQLRGTYAVQPTPEEEILSTVVMLLMLVTLCSSAVMVPSAKRYIESKYIEMHKRVPSKQVEWGKLDVDELRVVVRRYWVMAATGSPQFVMARSAISGLSGLLCLLMALTLGEAHLRVRLVNYSGVSIDATSSNYRWSINWISYTQSVGMVLGTIAPLFRWYVAGWFEFSEAGQKSMNEELQIEKYWTSRLVEWRESSLTIQIRHQKWRKLLHDAKRLVLNICIGVQILFVVTSKLVVHISAKFGKAFFLCFHWIKKPESGASTELDLRGYVLLLVGEGEMPEAILKNIGDEVDELIQVGSKSQPKNLIKLLRKFVSFNGVSEFDRNKVEGLHPQEPPNCWSLPVVTLTSIAIALPNIAKHKANQLLRGVSEGLSLIKCIEKTLDRNGELESIRDTADMIWVGVELYKQWQDSDLKSLSLKGRTHRETLQKLSDTAENTVRAFTAEMKDVLMQNPLNWPFKIIAATSMYRITQTILLDEHQTDEQVFERLSIVISGILAACLTNLVHVITLKCHKKDTKERQKSVREEAVLLGESEAILAILQQLEIPSMDPEKAANIDNWRAIMEADDEIRLVSASSNNVGLPQPSEEQVSISLECSL